jgi:hypothetical protein
MDLVSSMAGLRDVVESVHAQRKLLKIPVRKPLSKVEIFGNDDWEFEEDVLENLLKLSYEREQLAKRSVKLNEKKAKAIRSARKRVNQFAKSRQIQYDEKTQAIGIYQGETIYIGSLEKLKSDPTLPPDENDVIKGTLTKTEKRLYNDELQGYAFLNKQISEYINDLTNNEMQLVAFEKSVLKDKEYSFKENYLTVSLVDGKTYLCTRPVEEELLEEPNEIVENKEEEKVVEQDEVKNEVGVENGRD